MNTNMSAGYSVCRLLELFRGGHLPVIRDGRASAGPVDIKTFLRQVRILAPPSHHYQCQEHCMLAKPLARREHEGSVKYGDCSGRFDLFVTHRQGSACTCSAKHGSSMHQAFLLATAASQSVTARTAGSGGRLKSLFACMQPPACLQHLRWRRNTSAPKCRVRLRVSGHGHSARLLAATEGGTGSGPFSIHFATP